MIRRGAAALAAGWLLLPGPVGADSGLGFLRLPLSARQQGGGGAYGVADVLGVAENPALLTAQPRAFAAAGFNQEVFGSSEVVLGLGAGWMTGKPEDGAWGLAVVAEQMTTAAFDEVDPSGNTTGQRVTPSAHRFEVAGAYQVGELSGGFAMGLAGESFGSLPGDAGIGLSTVLVSAGVADAFEDGRIGAAYRFRQSGVASDVTAGGAYTIIGVWLSADLEVPLAAPAGPALTAGLRVPCSDAFDLQAAYATAVVANVAGSLAGSARLGFSLRGPGLGLDYTLVIPVFSGVGVTNLIALGWDFGEVRPAYKPPAPPWHGPDPASTPPSATP